MQQKGKKTPLNRKKKKLGRMLKQDLVEMAMSLQEKLANCQSELFGFQSECKDLKLELDRCRFTDADRTNADEVAQLRYQLKQMEERLFNDDRRHQLEVQHLRGEVDGLVRAVAVAMGPVPRDLLTKPMRRVHA